MNWFTRTTPAREPDAATPVKCSFCLKTQQEVRKLIAGPDVAICDECIGLCNDLVVEDQRALDKGRRDALAVPAPAELGGRLDDAAVGQPAAKRTLVAAVRQHLHAVKHPESAVRAPRVLLAGPTGCGKTTLSRALCANAGVPAHHADVTRLTESGYVGEDVENLAVPLVTAVAGDVEWAQTGLIVLDGLEKVRRRARDGTMTRDVAGEGVQRDLLRLLEGLPLELPTQARRHPQASTTAFDPARVLLVGTVCIDAPRDPSDAALRESLVQLGLSAELVARFDRIVPMQPLDEGILATIAGHTAGPLAEARRLVQGLGGELEWTVGALRVLASAAMSSGMGAWALRWPVQRLVEDVFAAAEPARTWSLDEDMARILIGGTKAPGGPYR